jgi:ATP-binding cassette subfamily C protein CydC
VVGAAGLYSFNYMLPAGFAVPQLPVPPGAILSGWSATTRHSACCNICASPHSATAAASPAGLSRFRQGELLNRVVADVDTLDHLYLRVISPLVGAPW